MRRWVLGLHTKARSLGSCPTFPLWMTPSVFKGRIPKKCHTDVHKKRSWQLGAGLMLIRKHIANTWPVSSEVFLINSLIYSSYCDHCFHPESLSKRVFKVSSINWEQYRNSQHLNPVPHLELLVRKAGWSDATDKTHRGHSKIQVQPDQHVWLTIVPWTSVTYGSK